MYNSTFETHFDNVYVNLIKAGEASGKLDVFLLKKKDNYIVNYVETRPTKLNGTININACLKEINQTLN